MAIHHRVCNLCEAMCGLRIEHEGPRVLSVRGDPDDPLSRGAICPKGARIADIYDDPDRLRRPLVKVDGKHVEVSWDEAIERAVAGLREVRERHGAEAIGIYLGNPTVHNLGSMMFTSELRRAIGTRSLYSPTSMDQLPHMFAAQFMFGHSMRMPIPDVDRCDFLILIGGNPLVSNGSLMSAPGIRARLDAIAARGAWVCVDPRRTESARRASEHLFIRPATDVFLLLAMLSEVFRMGPRLGRLSAHITGLEAVCSACAGFTPDTVAAITGIRAEQIRSLSERFLQTKRAVIYGRMGSCTQRHGAMVHWLINTLNLVAGHFDVEGGAMFTTPAIEIARGARGKRRHGRWKSRVSGLPEFDGELPVSVLAEEMLTPGEGQLRALLTSCGNPALAVAGADTMQRALAGLDFQVSVDIYLNETTRHADVILPPTTGLEIEHYDLVFNAFAVSNNARWSEPMVDPQPDRLADWQIFKRLILGLAERSPGVAFRAMTPQRFVNLGLLSGPYGKLSHPKRVFNGLSLKRLRSYPHGLSLGPLVPRVPEGLMTADQRIHLAPSVYLDALPSLRDELAAPAPEGLLLIGRRHLLSNNTWMHNAPQLMKGADRCTVMLHPKDAAEHGIEAGQTVRVSTPVGSIVLPAVLSDEMMPGVLSIPHGYGHNQAGAGLQVAARTPGVNVNVLLDPKQVDPVCNNLALSGQRVTIAAYV